MNEPLSSYETLIGPIEDRMIRSIWRIVRDAHDAEDAMQNALATIWKRWHRIVHHASPQALVLRICVQSAYDVARRRQRERRRVEASGSEPTDPAPPAAAEMAGRETHAAVVEALSRLSKRQATALSLRVFEEMPYEEIAAALGCGEATARKHVERARAHLRVALARHEPQGIRES